MPHSFGQRARTRDMFAKAFRTNGVIPLSTYMTSYKVGDYVDLKVNPTIHKGMPFKYYHGRTGVVYNVTKRAVGVRVNKKNNGKVIEKRIHCRVEHCHPSKCKDDWKMRIRSNEATKKAVREAGSEKKNLKRLPTQPKKGFFLEMEGKTPETIQALPFVDLM
jgi:large subunit ribosomal protein L21e